MSTSAWRRAVEALCERFGCALEATRASHWRLRHPDGWFVIASSTPRSEWRAIRNLAGDLRRAQKAHATGQVIPYAPERR